MKINFDTTVIKRTVHRTNRKTGAIEVFEVSIAIASEDLARMFVDKLSPTSKTRKTRLGNGRIEASVSMPRLLLPATKP